MPNARFFTSHHPRGRRVYLFRPPAREQECGPRERAGTPGPRHKKENALPSRRRGRDRSPVNPGPETLDKGIKSEHLAANAETATPQIYFPSITEQMNTSAESADWSGGEIRGRGTAGLGTRCRRKETLAALQDVDGAPELYLENPTLPVRERRSERERVRGGRKRNLLLHHEGPAGGLRSRCAAPRRPAPHRPAVGLGCFVLFHFIFSRVLLFAPRARREVVRYPGLLCLVTGVLCFLLVVHPLEAAKPVSLTSVRLVINPDFALITGD